MHLSIKFIRSIKSVRRFAFVNLLWIALLVHAAPHMYAQDAHNLLELASEDAKHGRYSSAKAEIEAALAVDGNQPEPWYQLGLLDGQMADYRGAEQAFRHSLTIDPRSAKAHYRLGQTLVAAPEFKEDWAGAVQEFQSALELDPNYAEAESLLGLGLTNLGDRPGAIATLRHAIQLHPTQASAHLNLALALEEQPDGENEAIHEYLAALAARPEAPDTECSLAKLLVRMGRLTEAEQAFRHALRLNPDLQDAHYGLGRVLKANKRSDEATIEFGLAAALERRRHESTQAIRSNNEALQLAAQGDLPGAIAGLRKAILLKPDYGIAKYNLGLILADSGDFLAAKEQMIEAASLLPGQATIWFDLGRVIAKTGDSHGALYALTWATRLTPANSRFADELKKLRATDLSQNQGKTQTSATPKGEADVASPGRPLLGAMSDTLNDRLAFARELRGRGDLSGAIGELTRALELKPNAVDARTELAEVFGSQARWQFAVEEYRKVLIVAGEEEVNAHLGLGSALLQTGQAFEAAEQFGKALQLQPDLAVARAGLEAAHRLLVPAQRIGR